MRTRRNEAEAILDRLQYGFRATRCSVDCERFESFHLPTQHECVEAI